MNPESRALRILHLGAFNTAGVPYDFVRMHRRFGIDARLVTLHRPALDFPEDICLNVPLPRGRLARSWRRLKRDRKEARTPTAVEATHLPIYRPANRLEALYFRYQDRQRSRLVDEAVATLGLDAFDIIHLDGGLDLYRDGRLVRRWKAMGKRIVTCYYGSDLRLRGIDPIIDQLADLHLTIEYDHTLRHPNIHYLFTPFGLDERGTPPLRPDDDGNRPLRLVHSPTDRYFKGTADFILPALERVAALRPGLIEVDLLEGLPRAEVLRRKAAADLAIDQVGNRGGTGYGKNSLETLSLDVVTMTDMTPDYEAWMAGHDHPFVVVHPDTLADRLIELIDAPERRRALAARGRPWVEAHHGFAAVHERLMALYEARGWLEQAAD